MKPIIFNTEMVKAILEGRKTVTRRVVSQKLLDKYHEYDEYCNCVMPRDVPCSRCYEEQFFMERTKYSVGDTLYVRETYADKWTPDGLCGYVYKADGIPPSFPYWGNDKQCKDEVWIPSIHMPKAAARLFLKVTDVSVSRLQDITEDEVETEGTPLYEKRLGERASYRPLPIDRFKRLWNSTVRRNELELYGWDANPWVWVIEFEVD